MLRFFMPSCNANKQQQQQQQRLSCVKVDFKYTMRFYPVALLCFAFSLTHRLSLSVCFIITFILTLHQTLALFITLFFPASAAAAAACLLCVLMSMLCLKGLAAPPTSTSNANRAPPPTIVRLCAR